MAAKTLPEPPAGRDDSACAERDISVRAGRDASARDGPLPGSGALDGDE
jgi:hypothetical protein